jgi:hypothetical protein
MKSYIFLMLLLLLTASSYAQNLSGVWEGQSNMGQMRLVIIQQGDSCFGYVYENSLGSCTAHFEGRFDGTKRELKGVNPSFIRKDFGHGLGRYTLRYDNAGQMEKLIGKVKAKSTVAQIMSLGMTLHCTLYRTNTPPDTTAFMMARLKELSSAIAALQPVTTQPVLTDSSLNKIERRETGAVQTIDAVEGLVKCTIYDNGTYDHDTVTVLHNNTIIIDRAEVSGKPLIFSIRLSKQQPVHELLFYANNLGEIPPNTGLLIIETGDKRFSLPIKADLSTNGKIVIQLRE